LPPFQLCPTQLLLAVMNTSLYRAASRLAAQWRAEGLRVELYPDAVKLDRQLKYADAKNIPYVAILGPDEAAAGKVTLKNLRSKTQQLVDQSEVAKLVK